MKTKVLENLAKAKGFYGYHTTVSEMGGLTVRICGKNIGNLGKPNVIFHLDDWEVPLFKTRKGYYNQTVGLKFSELICDLYSGFGKTSRVCFGSRIMKDTREADVMHFTLTMNPKEVRFLLIADRQTTERPHEVEPKIKQLANHYYLGQAELAEQKDERGVDYWYWDYYILPIGFKYREDSSVYEFSEEIPKRQKLIQEQFDRIFGSESASGKVKDILVGRAAVQLESASKPTQKSKKINPIEREHYDDGLYRVMTFVIDAYGRLLKPRNIDNNKATSFIDATVACVDAWDVVPRDALVIEYVQRGFSMDPSYKILRNPTSNDGTSITATSLQADRVAILEAQLTNERKMRAKDLSVEYMLFCGAVSNWSEQLKQRSLKLNGIN